MIVPKKLPHQWDPAAHGYTTSGDSAHGSKASTSDSPEGSARYNHNCEVCRTLAMLEWQMTDAGGGLIRFQTARGLPITYPQAVLHALKTHGHPLASGAASPESSVTTVFPVETISSITKALGISLKPQRSAMHAHVAGLHAAAQQRKHHAVDVASGGAPLASPSAGKQAGPEIDAAADSVNSLISEHAAMLSPFARKQLSRMSKSKSGALS